MASLKALASELDYPVEAFQFVLQTILVSAERTSDLGPAIRKAADVQFGPDARETLRAWNIHRSEDLGLMINGLVRGGFLVADSRDSLHHFDGQFELDELFDKKLPPRDAANQWQFSLKSVFYLMIAVAFGLGVQMASFQEKTLAKSISDFVLLVVAIFVLLSFTDITWRHRKFD